MPINNRIEFPSKEPNRKNELIEESIISLNARGISQTSLAEISDKLGISRAALYYYVDDREDLVFQCYRVSCERIASFLAHAARESTFEDEIIRNFISSALDQSAPNFASINEIGYLGEAQRDTIFGIYDGVVFKLAALISGAIQRRVYRQCDPVIVAQTLLSMLFWTPMARSWSKSVQTAAQTTVAEALIDLLDRGVTNDPSVPATPVPVSMSGFLPASAGPFDKAHVTRARREALLRAASWLFNRKGVDATSLIEIADRAGTTKRSILHHFGDKQNLVEATYKRGLSLSLYISEELAATDLPPLVKLASAFAALSQASLRDDLSLATPRLGLEAFRPEARLELEQLSDQLTRHYVDLLKAGQATNVVREIDILGFVAMAAGAFHWLHHGLADTRKPDEVKVASEISSLLLHGLVARS